MSPSTILTNKSQQHRPIENGTMIISRTRMDIFAIISEFEEIGVKVGDRQAILIKELEVRSQKDR
jgi:hypothetical protein